MKPTKQHILAIDDTPSNLMTLGAALADDYDLQFATSGQQGLSLAAQVPPDLILLDIMMPEMDDFARASHLRIRSSQCDRPVCGLHRPMGICIYPGQNPPSGASSQGVSMG